MASARYRRHHAGLLLERLGAAPARLVIVAGPRQVGKTTLVRDALPDCGREWAYQAAASEDGSPAAINAGATVARKAGQAPDADWIVDHWNRARARARSTGSGFVLALDEIQKVPRWSEVVKGLWDADRAEGLNLHVILLGSSPLLMRKGMTESLAGRFELLRLSHWSYLETHEAFDYSLEDFVFFGGYPGCQALIRKREDEWRSYVRDSLIAPSIEQDILMMTRIEKPAVLKQAFEVGCAYSGQILSLTKMLGHVLGAGHTVTLADYLNVIEQAGLLAGLQKYSGSMVRRRSAPPKFIALDPSLMSVHSTYSKAEAVADRTFWGRMVESAVGAHLYNARGPDLGVYYWRESPHEVDFVIERGRKLTAIEVKSGVGSASVSGLNEFKRNYRHATCVTVGGEGGISVSEFLSHPAEHWLGQGD
jgi:predicted AAA+ superfamily ATPase